MSHSSLRSMAISARPATNQERVVAPTRRQFLKMRFLLVGVLPWQVLRSSAHTPRRARNQVNCSQHTFAVGRGLDLECLQMIHSQVMYPARNWRGMDTCAGAGNQNDVPGETWCEALRSMAFTARPARSQECQLGLMYECAPATLREVPGVPLAAPQL